MIDRKTNRQKGSILAVLVLIIMLVGLGVGVYLVSTNKLYVFKSRASSDAITPVGTGVTRGTADGTWQTSNSTVEFEIRSPLAPAAPQ